MEIMIEKTGLIQANTYVCYDKETKKGFIVDPGGYSQLAMNLIENQEVEIEYIFLTHGHGDHIGGVEEFKKRIPNAKVVAHEKAKEMLSNPSINCSVELCGKPVTVEPDMYVKDGDIIEAGNDTYRIAYTPGHSIGGMCIISDHLVFTGDTLFRQSVGRTDFYGGDPVALEKSIREKLYVLPESTLVYPGHMDLTTIKYEKENNLFVRG